MYIIVELHSSSSCVVDLFALFAVNMTRQTDLVVQILSSAFLLFTSDFREDPLAKVLDIGVVVQEGTQEYADTHGFEQQDAFDNLLRRADQLGLEAIVVSSDALVLLGADGTECMA